MSRTAGSGWKIALAWGIWTALFEFGLGRATGGSWWELLADYDVAHGRYWSFVFSSVFIAPLLWSWVLTGRQG